MTEKEALQLLSSLLAEKGIHIHEALQEGGTTAKQRLVQQILSLEAGGALVDDVALALMSIFDAIAETTVECSPSGNKTETI